MHNKSHGLVGLLIGFGAAIAAACGSSSDDGPAGGSSGESAGGTMASAGAGGGYAGSSGAGHSGVAGNSGTSAGNAGTSAGNAGTSAGNAGTSAGNAGAAGGGQAGAGAGGTSAAGAAGSGAAGQAGAGGEAGGTDGGEHVFMYEATFLAGILAFDLDTASAEAHELAEPPKANGPLFTYVDDARRCLYALDQALSRIDVYRIQADGSLPHDPMSSITIDSAGALTLEPLGRFAYVSTGDGAARPFRRDPDTCALTATGTPLAAAGSLHMAAEPTGQFVYASGGEGLRGYRIDPDSGTLTEIEDGPFGASVAHGGAIVFRPDGAFLFCSGDGLHAGDGLSAFAIQRPSGKLQLVEGSPFSKDLNSDQSATDIAIDPSGKYIYTTSFSTRHISGFKIEPATGKLQQQVPGSPLTIGSPYSIGVEPTGHFAIVGDDGGTIGIYAIQSDGQLAPAPSSPLQRGGLQPGLAFATQRL